MVFSPRAQDIESKLTTVTIGIGPYFGKNTTKELADITTPLLNHQRAFQKPIVAQITDKLYSTSTAFRPGTVGEL